MIPDRAALEAPVLGVHQTRISGAQERGVQPEPASFLGRQSCVCQEAQRERCLEQGWQGRINGRGCEGGALGAVRVPGP